MSIGAAPNLRGGLSIVSAGGWGRNLQQSVDPFAAPTSCCQPGDPTCCQPGDLTCALPPPPAGCGNSSGGVLGSGGSNGPVVSAAMISGAYTPYPLVQGGGSCQCNPGQCPPPPPSSGPWCAYLVSAGTTSDVNPFAIITCVELGGYEITGDCDHGARVTWYFNYYADFHFVGVPTQQYLCPDNPTPLGVGYGHGYPGASPSACTTIVVTLSG